MVLLGVSWWKNRERTRLALRTAWRSFENILPQFLGVLLFTGILLSVTQPETISAVIGKDSGWLGTVGAALVGSFTLIPGFVAFPMAALLLQNGAGYMQIGAFVSTLMMVGVVTFPMERLYFGTRITILRNTAAFLFSFLVAAIISWVHTL